ncbi:MAG TPA: AraC family transcriptional regulator [Cyclobacteriaceae bacterium]|nr:AraC family transcriptional regulator [Cyclobacteriaceae bacterium]
MRTKLHIELHYAASLDLQAMAEMSCLSRYHFLRMFKAVFGLTPRQYLIQVRVNKAMQLLDNGLSVSEACFAVGLEGLSSFTRKFKQRTCVTPSAYRKEQFRKRYNQERSPLRFIPGCFLQQYVPREE